MAAKTQLRLSFWRLPKNFRQVGKVLKFQQKNTNLIVLLKHTENDLLGGTDVFGSRSKHHKRTTQNELCLLIAAPEKPSYLRGSCFAVITNTRIIEGTMGFWHAAKLAKCDQQVPSEVHCVEFWAQDFANI